MAVGDLQTTFTLTATRKHIGGCMRKWSVTDWDLLAGRQSVTLTYTVRGRPSTIECKRFETPEQNARAIFRLIDSLRLADQRGMLRELVEQATALLSAPSRKRPAHEVLGIFSTAPLAVAETAYRELAKEKHPDKGGTETEMKELNQAIDDFRELASKRGNPSAPLSVTRSVSSCGHRPSMAGRCAMLCT